MNIGLVCVDFYPNVGGIAAHVFELGRGLVRLGHRVHVYTVPSAGHPSGESEFDGMRVHRTAVPKFKPIYSRMTRWMLNREIEKHGLEVIHVHGIRPLEATRGLSVPVVFTNHSSGFLKRIEAGESQRRRIGKRLTHLAHVLAPSRELAERTKDAGYAGPVDYIPNGVDVNKFLPGESACRGDWGVELDTPVLLLGRRLVEKNGVVVFAEALKHLSDLKWAAVFAGDGPERGRVESILEAGAVRDRCRLLGNVPNDLMSAVYRAADISILPSFMEATSITGLESMATALPLVGTNVGGIPELIRDGETGLLVESGDPVALAGAIRRLLVDASLRQRMGQAARERAEENFSWDSIAEQTVDVFRQHTLETRVAA